MIFLVRKSEQTYKLVVQESMDTMAFGVDIKDSMAPFPGVTSIHTKTADSIKNEPSHREDWKVQRMVQSKINLYD